jgi:hypothetical protein
MGKIKLEVGQRVRLRNGAVHVVKANRWKFRVGCGTYLESGKYFDDPGESDIDVVEILPPEPTPAPEPKWEVGKWYPCRNGLSEGKIFETGLPGKFQMIGFCRTIADHKDWCPVSWTSEGLSNSHRDLDLMPPAPPVEPNRHKVTWWAICYVCPRKGPWIWAVYGDLKNAKDAAASSGAWPGRPSIRPFTVEFTEGEGLS